VKPIVEGGIGLVEDSTRKRVDREATLAVVPLATLYSMELIRLTAGRAFRPLVAVLKDCLQTGGIVWKIEIKLFDSILFHRYSIYQMLPAVKG
jgi:hypothetical protein